MYALALGIGTKNMRGEWLEVYFPAPLFHPETALVDVLGAVLGYQGGNLDIAMDSTQLSALSDGWRDHQQQNKLLSQLASRLATAATNTRTNILVTILETDEKPQTRPETYLKLHLLSHRYLLPNQQNLDGIFSLLPNVAWTNQGAVDLEDLEQRQLEARLAGTVLEVAAVDKFPKMTNYVVPPKVRIAHSARVRLGAYLGAGTVVMHEGLMNFNSATIGPNMVEGRVSQGVILDAGADLGGGASTAGTLSGGGNIAITIGKNCLISANAGTGIPLGDNCTIEAGLYITPGIIVQMMDAQKNVLRSTKARELAGQDGMLFIRNSRHGAVECHINTKAISLNKTLHTHN